MTEQREQSFVCSLNTKPSFFGGFFVFHEILLLRPFETLCFSGIKLKGEFCLFLSGLIHQMCSDFKILMQKYTFYLFHPNISTKKGCRSTPYLIFSPLSL